MKVEEHSSLWSAIQQFPLDDPNAEINFSRKLSAKQRWSPSYTAQVIEEYRKFLFLCCISPNGASPSQAVDEAWHLHLTYTQSYWTDLCKNTLKKDVHHHPSRGGDEEDHKHRDWYAETLSLYQSVFESPPPEDIWPPPLQPKSPIEEPVPIIRNTVIALIVVLLLFPFLLIYYQHGVFFPFSLTGKQFIGFLPLLAVSSILCHMLIQNEKFKHFPALADSWFPEEATAFEIARFLYGRKRAMQTAIVDLIRRNLLVLTTDKLFLLYPHRYVKPENERNPLIPALLKDDRSSVTYDSIIEQWGKDVPEEHSTLQQLHELANRKESFFKKYNFLIIPFAIGIARFIQGVANYKPVSYLFVEIMVLLLVTSLVVKAFSGKTAMFKRISEKAKTRNEFGWLYDDKVVADFAMKGNDAISGFSDGIVLIGLFGMLPFFDRTANTLTNFWEDLGYGATSDGGECGSSGGGCSGGGSCGGSCGGGCGGCGS
ncbi:glycine-rich domain-containing protein [Niastella populi]|uniref:TIGR04222 domain-containing membrane protein n=1 Tax=Niastella populi TaxID=550983 RepID=A0A1V9F5S9_9BACT|nr:hypothetical protein [Niastella populi]OQP53714.1 hypothetical protein A4R26_07040 [Niastella populi]